MCNCLTVNDRRLAINGGARIDPSRTSAIRAAFVRQVNQRFAKLRKDIKTSIVDNDCFGFKRMTTMQAATPGQFAFMRDPAKIQAFMDWLKAQEDAGILTLEYRPGTAAGIEAAWSDTYIRAAYLKGIQRADLELDRSGVQPAPQPVGGVELSAVTAFNQPVHADRVGALYTRVFEELKTVTQVMNMQIQRTIADGLRSGLAQGLASGLGPEKIAKNLMADVVNRVDVIGITRARMIARTEVIRAHHLGNIAEYRRADAELSVEVKAEWSALDDACPICADFNGKVFTLDEIENMIPAHPNCRCVAIPYVVGIHGNRHHATPRQTEAA